MPYRFWTLETENEIDIHLIVNGKKITEVLASVDASQPNTLQSDVVRDIFDEGGDKVKLILEGKEFTLGCEKLKKTTLFGCCIDDKKSLMNFWNDTSGFLKQRSDDEDEDDNESLSDIRFGPFDENASVSDDDQDHEDQVKESILPDVPSTSPDHRHNVFERINKKSVGKHFLDIFDLKEPPKDFEVRQRDEDFVNKLSQKMIEKSVISIDNSANIIGLVLINKEEFESSKIKSYQIFIIDGNHNAMAQKIAYEKTKDPVFRYREVHIYCNLSSEEALILGTSRNEDASLSLKFTDFEKVDLVRRYLYASSDVSPDQEPPEQGSMFTNVYKQLLNLKTKKEVDAKAVIRFLATKLSRRNYLLFSTICEKNNKIKASKFEPLRGLAEPVMFEQLSLLANTSCKRTDWLEFKNSCQKSKKEKMMLKTNTTATLTFDDFEAIITTSDKKTVSGCVSVTFNSSDGETRVMTIRELEKVIFVREDTGLSEGDNTVDVSQRCLSGTDSSLKGGLKHMLDESSEVTPKKKHKGCEVTSKKRSNLIQTTITELRRSPRKNAYESKKVQKQSQSIRKSPRKVSGKRNVFSFCSDEDMSPIKLREKVNVSFCSDDDLSPLKARGTSQSKAKEVVHSTPIQNANAALKQNFKTKNSCYDQHMPETCPRDGVSVASVDTFLREMVTEDAFLRVKFIKGSFVEQEEVETMPENLTHIDLLLDIAIQERAKKYFTEDAWMNATSTIKMLKDFPPVKEKLKSPEKKGGEQKQKPGTSQSKAREVVHSTPIQNPNADLPPLKEKLKSSAKKGSEQKQKPEKKSGNANARSARVRLTDISSVRDIIEYERKKGLKASKEKPAS